MKPESYTEKKRCSNCKFVFVREEWGQEPLYCCCHDGSQRPICMSVKMHELPGGNDEDFKRALITWAKWAADHKVAFDARCNDYVKDNGHEKE